MAPIEGMPAAKIGTARSAEVVEIGLLLPASWVDALLEMSKRRGQSVGQLLRGLIDQALVDERAIRP
jgi:hypothetical protein